MVYVSLLKVGTLTHEPGRKEHMRGRDDTL